MALRRNHISNQGDRGKVGGFTRYYAAIAF